jgi:hypothetical protein
MAINASNIIPVFLFVKFPTKVMCGNNAMMIPDQECKRF